MTLITAITTFGLTAGFFIWLFVYLFVLNPDKGERIAGWMSRLFAWGSKKAERTATSRNIRSKIESFIKSIDTEVKDLLPYGLKIKWLSPETTKEAFIEEDRVVIMLNYHQNQDENLSKTTLLYINKALIPDARPHIHKKLTRAIDLMMTKKALFSFIEARSALNHFIDSVLRPESDSDTELKELCSVIDLIDERGLFTRILLRELMELGIKRAGVTETGDTVHETNEFTKMLKRISEKEKGKDVDPTFLKNNIRVSIIFVARPEKVTANRTKPYLDVVNSKLKKSVHTFYIFARGDRNISFAKSVTKACLQKFKQLTKGYSEEHPTKGTSGTIVNGYYAILYNRKI